MARCTWELGMDVWSDAGGSQQADVVEASKTNVPVSRWSSDSKSNSSFVTYSATQKAAWRPSVSNDETALSKLRCVHRLSPSLSSPSQEPGFKHPTPLNQPGVSTLHRLRLHLTRFLSCISKLDFCLSALFQSYPHLFNYPYLFRAAILASLTYLFRVNKEKRMV